MSLMLMLSRANILQRTASQIFSPPEKKIGISPFKFQFLNNFLFHFVFTGCLIIVLIYQFH